jgi:putative mRNA 3-end processing factor
MAKPNLLEFRDKGIYCPQADIYIDPWHPVDRAVITHAHADHSRWGHKYYLAHHNSATVMRLRLGADINLETVGYNEPVYMNGVKISLHPAGHIFGSAQIRLEWGGEVWVAAGDYKVEDDKLSAAFEPVKCNAFITESTFGLPIYRWRPQEEIFNDVNEWWQTNRDNGRTSVIFAYSLGKTQRIMHHLDTSIGRIFTHGAGYNTNKALEEAGMKLPPYTRVGQDVKKDEYAGGIILAPPSANGTPWMKKFQPLVTGLTSGWMNLRGAKRRRAVDRGFILSDHADWDGLVQAITATGAERIFVTHGYTAAFSRYLNEEGWDAHEVYTLYEGESDEKEIAEAGGETPELQEEALRSQESGFLGDGSREIGDGSG